MSKEYSVTNFAEAVAYDDSRLCGSPDRSSKRQKGLYLEDTLSDGPSYWQYRSGNIVLAIWYWQYGIGNIVVAMVNVNDRGA